MSTTATAAPGPAAWATYRELDLDAEYEKALKTTDDALRDPHPIYDELRAQGSVYRGDVLTDVFKLPYSMANMVGDREVFTFLSHDACAQAYRHPEIFSSTVLQETVGRVQGNSLITFDPPEHTRLRRLLTEAFNRKQFARWRDEIVDPVVQEVFAQFAHRGSADLMREFALWLPIRVVHEIIGLDAGLLEEFTRLAVGLQLVKTRPDIAGAASNRLAELFGEVIDRRRREPGNTTVDVLIGARVDGEHSLTDEEILAFLRVLLVAGGETTTRGLGSLLVGLLNDPQQLDLLRQDRTLLPQAVEEALRWESPTQFNYRLTKADVEIDGVHIPAGSGINLCVGAANRDPMRYEDPHRFDIRRKPRGHLAFGFGAHLCIGMHVARTEITLATNAVLDRLPGVRLPAGHGPLTIEGSTFRNPSTIPVEWDV
ncbi:cytochrome P450 [Amycolatopsis sp. YIM 10]|uniref:cytochrome P450 n=1 Tax=Amycolatopsis sp. YIM 10 TaxID=2653857 RepID=UPI00129010D3|nr:cytochrome P450 [Amycolatopsis sp. YIM 10]QFU89561.1 Cytochrome P450 107B1 [Amycolatopsis sp. YIM 10]